LDLKNESGPYGLEHQIDKAAVLADALIAQEVALQDAMWGKGNERADATKGQMLKAAQAQLSLVELTAMADYDLDTAIRIAQGAFYPQDWSGFRHYGSNVSNLVVAVAYLRNEIKRRIVNGEDTLRTSRPKSQPYSPDTGLPSFTTADADWVEKMAR